MSRKVGAVLVKDNCIVSTGYNGPARGVSHCYERDFEFYDRLNSEKSAEQLKNDYPTICPRKDYGYKSGQGLHLCQAAHAERNAILQAARNGICTKDTILYCYCGVPCKDCMIEIINAGIKKIVCLGTEYDYDSYARILAIEAGIELVEIEEFII